MVCELEYMNMSPPPPNYRVCYATAGRKAFEAGEISNGNLHHMKYHTRGTTR